MRIKKVNHRILSLIIALTLLLSIVPSTVSAWSAPSAVTINKTEDAAYFKRADGSDMQTGFYYISGTNEIAYCADADAFGPGGTGYALNDGALSGAYLSGIQVILQNGYPYTTNGLSADDARYATQAAIHWAENYYLGGTNGWNYTLMDTVNANGHDAALTWAKALFNIGVNQPDMDPKVTVNTPTAWSNAGGVQQCTVQVNESYTDHWTVTTLPAGVSLVGGSTFTGDVTLILQLTDPVAYAASNKIIAATGYTSCDLTNIHVFSASGFQTMIAVSTQLNALDPHSVTLQDATGGFAIHKVTQTLAGDIPEAGATFRIFSTKYASYDVTPDAEKGEITTDASGNGSRSGLPYGTYYLDQISAPTGVTLIPRQMVTVDAASINNAVTYLNTLGYGHIDLTKRMNQSGTPYEPGATFRIYLKSAGSYDASPADQRDQITTDANGHAITKDLPYGEYCMIQISAAVGMKVDTTVREYRIGMDASGNPLIDQTIYENIVNDLAYGRIEIHKTTDYTVDVPEANAEFQVFPIKYASYADATAAGAAAAVITTDATGYAISPYLPFDRYVVVQSKAPAGTIPGFGFFVWIGAVDQAVEHVDLVNQTYWGTIRVQKYTVSPSDPDHVQTPESGATFRVYPSSYASYDLALANDTKAVDTCDTFTTGANGLGQTSHQLPYGAYIVEQIDNAATANTFKVDPWQVTIGPVQNGVYTYTRENQRYEQFLRIIKTDADTGAAIPIAGATFEILDAAGNVLKDRSGNGTFSTDTTGTVNLSTLPLLSGTYGIRETAAPTGYALSADILSFTVAKSDHGTGIVTVEGGKDIRTVTIENRKISGRLNISKLGSDTGLPLSGVVFEIYDKDGKLVDTITTDANGKASTKVLPYGQYAINEIKTNTGYVLGPVTYFEIYRQPLPGELYSDTDLTMYNDRMAKISVSKVTQDGSVPMDGVVFGIYNADTGKEITRLTTDAKGTGSVYVTPGNYYMQELETWPGYAISTEKLPIKNAALNEVYHFAVTNKPTSVIPSKVNQDGAPLAGMEFMIQDKSGNIIKMYWDASKSAYVVLDSAKITAPAGATILERAVTGADGSACILGLIAGKEYTITETAAPAGYHNDSQPVTITVSNTSGVAGVARFVDSAIVITTVEAPKTGETDDHLMLIAVICAAMAAAGTVALIIGRKKRKTHRE